MSAALTADQNKVQELIKSIIFRTFTEDEKLVTQNILDSMALVELVLALESEFSIKINPTEMTMENFDSISQILKLIAAKKAKVRNST